MKTPKVHVLHPPKEPVHDEDDGDHGGGDHGGGGHCPPPWILTFADMVTLLMAFFVMLLMTSKTDEPKFNAFASSMRETFGRTPLVPSEDKPGGSSVLDMNFGPQYGDPKDEPATNVPEGGATPEPESSSGDPVSDAGKQLAQMMSDAVANGEVTIESDAGSVTLRLPKGMGQDSAEKLANALAEAAGTTATSASGADDAAGSGNAGSGGMAEVEAKTAAVQLGVALREQLADGTVQVEQRDGKMFVTVGAGGAFQSGSGDLTAEAQSIMDKIAGVTVGSNTRITVTGHTDSVPLSGSRYRDNWDLAAARAASVVQQLSAAGVGDAKNFSAVSKGDGNPVGDNATEEGRAKNRRIEIEVQYGE